MKDWTAFSYGFTSGRHSKLVGAGDEAIARRLIDAYRRASSERAPRADDKWSEFIESHYGEMIDLIGRDDARGLVAYLLSLPRQGAAHGFFQGRLVHDGLQDNPEGQLDRAWWLLDHLVALAEAVGVLRVRCPEQGDWDSVPFGSVPELRDRIERAIGLPLTLPDLFEGLFALEPNSGAIHLRSIMATYAVRQVATLLENLENLVPPEMKVAEIGAGIGYTAYAAQALGISRYTLFDLPEVNVAQGFFLLETIDPGAVRLFGEEEGAPIEVLPASAFPPRSPDGFHVVVNIDSLPEIDPVIVDGYVNGIAERSRYLFSINQEAPLTGGVGLARRSVRQSVSLNPRLKAILRQPNWIRAGYVEEIFAALRSTPLHLA